MIRTVMALLLVAFVLSLTGCSGAKQCKKENMELKARIDSLSGEYQKSAQLQREQSEKMKAAMQAEIDSKQVTIQELEGKLKVTMVETLLFDSGKAVVKKDGVESLKKVAEVLKTTTNQNVIVAGYTDNKPIGDKLTGVYASNWELSAARAIAVVKILKEAGVDPTVLGAMGYGEFRPVADNSTPEGRAQNRRMEIVLMAKRS
jgi:chemotaxis protein MotB